MLTDIARPVSTKWLRDLKNQHPASSRSLREAIFAVLAVKKHQREARVHKVEDGEIEPADYP